MTRRSVPTKEHSELLGDEDAIVPAETAGKSVHHLPPKCRRGKEGVLKRDEKAGDEVTWLVQLIRTMGTEDLDLASRLLNQVINVAAPRPAKKNAPVQDANAAVAAVNGIGPRDAIEGLLAVQMVAVHNAAMNTLEWGSHYDQPIRGAQRYLNLSTKLLRTFTAQVECLERYRGKTTKQKVTVEHVHISEGGQAIVGAVSKG